MSIKLNQAQAQRLAKAKIKRQIQSMNTDQIVDLIYQIGMDAASSGMRNGISKGQIKALQSMRDWVEHQSKKISDQS